MKTIGKYRVLQELGAGGFGAVYLAEDRLGQQVAIKLFKLRDAGLASQATSASKDASEALRERFISEARTLRQLSSNPYIVDMYDFDELEDGTPYYVMPYLPRSLVDDIGKDAFSTGALEDLPQALHPRRLPPSRALQLLSQVLDALSAVHAADLVHRDIKPANILFTEQGQVQVCDFGIAKLPDTEHSQSGVGMGSRNYMSPEQRESAKHVTPQADIYAVGVLAYRMLTGTLPVGRFDDPIVYVPQLSPELNELILDAIAQHPEQRPADAQQMALKLRQGLRSMDQSAPEADGPTATFTDVSGAIQGLRDELKPLRERVQALLLEHGELPAKEKEGLLALGAIADLDEAGLDALVDDVIMANQAQIKPIQNFLKLLDQRLNEQRGQLNATSRQALIEAAAKLGWDAKRVKALIAERGAHLNRLNKEAKQRPAKNANQSSAQASSNESSGTFALLGRILAGILVLAVLGAGGYYGVNTYIDTQDAAAERLKQETLARQKEQAAWAQAEKTDDIAAYQAYLDTWPDSISNREHRRQAEQRIDTLQEQQRLAQANEQDAETQLISNIQDYLNRLGYRVPNSGELDARTKAGIEAFEKQQKLLVTGTADSVILASLKEEHQRRDQAAWDKAKSRNNESAYRQYAQDFPKGQYVDQVASQIDKIKKAIAAREEAERIAREKAAKAERDRLAREQAAREQAEREQAERERLAELARQERQQLIADVQGELKRLGIPFKSKADFGSGPEDSILYFQTWRNLQVDGEVDKQLLADLRDTADDYFTKLAQPVAKVESFSNDTGRLIIAPSAGTRLRLGSKLYALINNREVELQIHDRRGANLVSTAPDGIRIPVGTLLSETPRP